MKMVEAFSRSVDAAPHLGEPHLPLIESARLVAHRMDQTSGLDDGLWELFLEYLKVLQLVPVPVELQAAVAPLRAVP